MSFLRLFLVVLLVALSTVQPAAASVPVAQELPPPRPEVLFASDAPAVSAITWILYDDTFDRVLAAEGADDRRAVASTTKMMTALVVLDQLEMTDIVTISQTAVDIGESEIDLVLGERWTVRDLFTAMLIRSANDAAVALAEHAGGSVDEFVELMNGKAAELGLENSQFRNPHGLDEPGHFSSARDLLTIARAGMENADFAQTVRAQVARMPDDPEGGERIALATNRLLDSYPGAIGVKTGFTDDAGRTLASAAERDGRRLYAVVLGSTDHFTDAAALLDYGFREFGVVQLVASGDVYGSRRSAGLFDEAVASESFDLFLGSAEAAAVAIVPEYLDGRPVLVAEVGDDEIGRIALDVDEPPPLPSLSDAFSWASRYWDWAFGNE